MREYLTPDFDVTIYEVEDIITLSIGTEDPDHDKDNEDETWWGGND